MHILLLSSMDSNGMKGLLRCLEQAGHTAVIIGSREGCGSLLMSCCRDFYIVPQSYFVEGPELLNLIQCLYHEDKCDILLPACIPSIIFTSQNKNLLAGNIVLADWAPAEVIQKLNNKWCFYNYIHEIGVNTPYTILLSSREEAADPAIAFPVLTKPLESGGGIGIKYFGRREEYDSSLVEEWPAIMQEYLPGYDIDVSIYSRNGVILGSAVQQSWRGGLIFSHNKHAVDLCRQIAAGCAYTGLAHFDLRYDERDGQLKCLECNPRCWGTIWASARAGINFPDLLLKGELAGELPLEAKPQWVPYFKKQVLKDPVNILKHWREFSHASYEYVRYVKDNFAYEAFIMTMVRSAALADWWMERIYEKGSIG